MEHYQSSGSEEKTPPPITTTTTTTAKTRLIRSLSGLAESDKKSKKKERRKSSRQNTDEDIFSGIDESGGDYEILMKTLGSHDESDSSLPVHKIRKNSFNTSSDGGGGGGGGGSESPQPLRRDSGRGQTVEMYAKISKEFEALRWDHAAIIGRICKIELDFGKLKKEIEENEEKSTNSHCCCLPWC